MKMHILFLNGKSDSTQKSPREACTCLEDRKLSLFTKELSEAQKQFKKEIEKAESLERIAANFRGNAEKDFWKRLNSIAECFLKGEMGENIQECRPVREVLEEAFKRMSSE